MRDRLTIITDAHGRPYNELEKANALQMYANALSGEWGSGKWVFGDGSGFWVKQGIMWQAKIYFDVLPATSVRLPFVVKNGIVSAYEIVNSTTLNKTSYFLADNQSVYFVAYTGKKVLIVVEPTLIVKG